MQRLFAHPRIYLSVAFILLLACVPLISAGTTEGPAFLWWLGLAVLLLGASIPPVQRLMFSPDANSG